MDLPFNVLINGKIVRMLIGKSGVRVNSDMAPLVDPTGYYLKQVII